MHTQKEDELKISTQPNNPLLSEYKSRLSNDPPLVYEDKIEESKQEKLKIRSIPTVTK